MTVIAIQRHQSHVSPPSNNSNPSRSPTTLPYFEVLIIFKIFYWILLSPNKIVFNKTLNQFTCIHGGKIRKILCTAFSLCVPINVIIHYGADTGEIVSGTLALMLKIAYVTYGMWGISFTYVAWTKMDKIAELFNQFYGLRTQIEYTRVEVEVPVKVERKKDAPCWRNVWLMVGMVLAVCCIENIYNNVRLHERVTSRGLLKGEKENPIFRHIKCAGLFALESLKFTTVLDKIPSFFLYVFGIIHLLTNTWRGICFLHLDLLIICWAFQFRRMICDMYKNFKKTIQRSKNDSKYLTQEKKLDMIRTFMKYCSLLEHFNKVLGILVLTGTVAETIYVCVNSAALVKADTNSSKLHTLSVIASFIPFFLALLIPSEIHHLAKKFPTLMKRSFMNEMELSPSIKPAQSGETEKKISEAMNYIQYDLEVNSGIGFQGLGFFTLSYLFLGQIVTAITTYSLVILQLSEKSNNE